MQIKVTVDVPDKKEDRDVFLFCFNDLVRNYNAYASDGSRTVYAIINKIQNEIRGGYLDAADK